jgi:arylsulfatase A-like enzyme
MPVRNVILFLTDQQRKDSLGCQGNPAAKTPNFDRLAREGARFERAYTQNPFCCPARASILTGVYLMVGTPTLGDLLQPRGFRTGSVGKIHVNPWFGPPPPTCNEESFQYWQKHPEMAEWTGPYCGFQKVQMVLGHGHYSIQAGHYPAYLRKEFPEGIALAQRDRALRDEGHLQTWHNAVPEEHHYNTWIADRTVEMIDSFGADRFFIHCSFPDPHHPFTACEPYASLFPADQMPDPLAYSEEELNRMPPLYLKQFRGERSPYNGKPSSFVEKIAGAPLKAIMAQTYGMVSHVDSCIGRILDHLEERGLLEETLIVFTTDHGELLGDHGFLFKGPFYYQSLVNVPMIIRNPGCSPEVREELVGHVDLVPTILEALGLELPDHLPGRSLMGHLEGNPRDRRDAVLTEFRPFGLPNMKILHTEDWKYVHYQGQDYGELFHLREDPEERHNLYDDPGYRGMRNELTTRLLEELVATEASWPSRGAWE